MIPSLWNFNVEIGWAKEVVRWRSREGSIPTTRTGGAGRRFKKEGGHRFQEGGPVAGEKSPGE